MKNTNTLKEFAKYTSLNVLGMLGLSCYILADTFFVSQGLGVNGLTALNLAIPIYSLVHGSGLMLGIGGATKYSICKGRENRKITNAIFMNTIYMAAIIAFLFSAAGIFFSGAIAEALGADTAVHAMTNTYLKVILLFAPAFILNDVLICFVRNDGNPRLSMIAMLGGSISNVFLDYLFIFPLRMGIFGAVFATGLAPLISMVILSWHLLKRKHEFHLIKTKPNVSLMRSLLALGFPSLVTEVSSGIVIVVFNVINGKLAGNTGIAAYGVVANLSLVVVAVFTGIAQGIQPLVSKAHGNGDPAAVKRVVRYAMTAMLILSCVIYICIFLFANPIADLFNQERNALLQKIAVDGLRLYFTGAVPVGFNIILAVFFTSTERVMPAHLMSLLRGLILIIPFAFLLSAIWGVTGVWLAFPTTEWIVSLLGVGLLLLRQRN